MSMSQFILCPILNSIDGVCIQQAKFLTTTMMSDILSHLFSISEDDMALDENSNVVLNPNIHRWMNEDTIAANEAAAVAVGRSIPPPTPVHFEQYEDEQPAAGTPDPPAALVRTNQNDASQATPVRIRQQDDNRNAELLGLLEIFPNINIDYAQGLLEQEENDIERVLQLVTDLGYYARDDDSETTSDAATNSTTDPTIVEPTEPLALRKETVAPEPVQYTHDFMSPASFKPSHRYKLQSLEYLASTFSFLDNRKLNAIFEYSSRHYAIAHDSICQTILAKADTPAEPNSGKKCDELLFCVLFDKNAVKTQEVELLVEMFNGVKSRKTLSFSLYLMRRRKKAPRITSSTLREELRYVEEKTMGLKRKLEAGISKRRLREDAIRQGNAITCSCCYEDLPLEEMVACRDEGHLFCEECLAHYVETQVFGNGSLGYTKDKEAATEIQCCAGDCSSGFDLWALRKALKEKVLQKYDELQYRTTIEKAGLSESMSSCPKCDLAFELPEEANLFVCPIEGCGYEACRHCGEPPHIGQTCDEVEREGEEQGRVRVEEAATAAIIRKCPTCRKGILKEDGCNKMNCPCGTKFCYCCQKKIKDYTHFCQKPHCTHADPKKCQYKCPLYTNSYELEIQDREAAREAALSEAAKVNAENNTRREENQGIPRRWGSTRTQTPRNVDVEGILAVPRM